MTRPEDLRTKPLHRRSGFYPTLGSVLILVGEGIEAGTPWYLVAASCLIVVGLFLGGARSKSVAARDVADVVNEQVEGSKPWQKNGDVRVR